MSPARAAVLRDMLVLDVSEIVNSVNIVPDVVSWDLNLLETAFQDWLDSFLRLSEAWLINVAVLC